MDGTEDEDYWTTTLLVIFLILSLLVSNFLYCIFQYYHYTRPSHQNNAINFMYAFLSVNYQVLNIHACASVIIKLLSPEVGELLSSSYPLPTFLCVCCNPGKYVGCNVDDPDRHQLPQMVRTLLLWLQ